jgi:tetratricopeptide (TPR) repeat protein
MSALLVAGQARGQEDDPEVTARTYFAAGKYQEALDIFAKLYAHTLHPTYLRNIGRCYQNMGRPDEAITAFREYLRKAGTLDPNQQAEIDRYIAEMEALKAQREAKTAAGPAPPAPAPAPSTAAPITLDHLEPTPRAAPTPSVEASLRASPAAPVEPASPFYKRWWFWTAVGAAVAGGVAVALVASASRTPQATTTFGTQSEMPR